MSEKIYFERNYAAWVPAIAFLAIFLLGVVMGELGEPLQNQRIGIIIISGMTGFVCLLWPYLDSKEYKIVGKKYRRILQDERKVECKWEEVKSE